MAIGPSYSPYPWYTPPVPPPILPPTIGTNVQLTGNAESKEPTKLEVYIIWVYDAGMHQHPVALDVWDADTRSDEEDEFLAAVKKAEEEWGGSNVRVTKTEVNYDALMKAFEPVDI